jgi:hypothetical protein
MKLTWDELKDDQGTYWASMPYVIRTFGVTGSGELTYRLEGPGVDSKSDDVSSLMIEAQLDADRAAFRKALGV